MSRRRRSSEENKEEIRYTGGGVFGYFCDQKSRLGFRGIEKREVESKLRDFKDSVDAVENLRSTRKYSDEVETMDTMMKT